MALSALQICAAAYRQANLEQDLGSFVTAQEWPYNIALDLLQTVIRDINRKTNYRAAQDYFVLPYSVGMYEYYLPTYGIDPGQIIRLRSETPNYVGELVEYNWRDFQRLYRSTPIPTQKPFAWSKYDNKLELSSVPDQDYKIVVYYYIDFPLPVNPSDTFLLSDSDLDVVQEGVLAYLLHRMGRSDYAEAYSVYQGKLDMLAADQEQDAGLPWQMPANF